LIISLLNQKGGVGKTTLAIHVAMTLARRGRRVLLVDADPQHSALDWNEAREESPCFPVIGLATKTLHRDIDAHKKNYDDLIIDGPPRVNELARAAIMAADLVLIPVTPSPYDVWAAKEITDLLNEASAFKPDLKSVFVINRKIANTAIGRDVSDALAGYPFPVLKATITQRVAFAESAAQGLTVQELDATGAASAEIEKLVDELVELGA